MTMDMVVSSAAIELPKEREMDPGIILVPAAVEHYRVVHSLNIAVQEGRHWRLRLRLRRQILFLVISGFGVCKGVGGAAWVVVGSGRGYFHEGSSVFTCNGDDPHSQIFRIREFLDGALIFGWRLPLPFG